MNWRLACELRISTYGNGLSELGGVLEATGLLEDAGGGTGLDCLQSRSLSAQGGGEDTTRDHAELGYGQEVGGTDYKTA